jgi:hypothetical protein
MACFAAAGGFDSAINLKDGLLGATIWLAPEKASDPLVPAK